MAEMRTEEQLRVRQEARHPPVRRLRSKSPRRILLRRRRHPRRSGASRFNPSSCGQVCACQTEVNREGLSGVLRQTECVMTTVRRIYTAAVIGAFAGWIAAAAHQLLIVPRLGHADSWLTQFLLDIALGALIGAPIGFFERFFDGISRQ